MRETFEAKQLEIIKCVYRLGIILVSSVRLTKSLLGVIIQAT